MSLHGQTEADGIGFPNVWGFSPSVDAFDMLYVNGEKSSPVFPGMVERYNQMLADESSELDRKTRELLVPRAKLAASARKDAKKASASSKDARTDGDTFVDIVNSVPKPKTKKKTSKHIKEKTLDDIFASFGLDPVEDVKTRRDDTSTALRSTAPNSHILALFDDPTPRSNPASIQPSSTSVSSLDALFSATSPSSSISHRQPYHVLLLNNGDPRNALHTAAMLDRWVQRNTGSWFAANDNSLCTPAATGGPAMATLPPPLVAQLHYIDAQPEVVARSLLLWVMAHDGNDGALYDPVNRSLGDTSAPDAVLTQRLARHAESFLDVFGNTRVTSSSAAAMYRAAVYLLDAVERWEDWRAVWAQALEGERARVAALRAAAEQQRTAAEGSSAATEDAVDAGRGLVVRHSGRTHWYSSLAAFMHLHRHTSLWLALAIDWSAARHKDLLAVEQCVRYWVESADVRGRADAEERSEQEADGEAEEAVAEKPKADATAVELSQLPAAVENPVGGTVCVADVVLAQEAKRHAGVLTVLLPAESDVAATAAHAHGGLGAAATPVHTSRDTGSVDASLVFPPPRTLTQLSRMFVGSLTALQPATESAAAAAMPGSQATGAATLSFKASIPVTEPLARSLLVPAHRTPHPQLDLLRLFDWRNRRYFHDRYEARANLFEWDLLMRLRDNNSILHQYYYKRFREFGLALELARGTHHRFNNTLLTSAPATERTKGRIALKGFWGDIISGPFACWGCESVDRDVLETRQQQHTHSVLTIAETNVSRVLTALSLHRYLPLPPSMSKGRKERADESSTEDAPHSRTVPAVVTPSAASTQVSVVDPTALLSAITLATNDTHPALLATFPSIPPAYALVPQSCDALDRSSSLHRLRSVGCQALLPRDVSALSSLQAALYTGSTTGSTHCSNSNDGSLAPADVDGQAHGTLCLSGFDRVVAGFSALPLLPYVNYVTKALREPAEGAMSPDAAASGISAASTQTDQLSSTMVTLETLKYMPLTHAQRDNYATKLRMIAENELQWRPLPMAVHVPSFTAEEDQRVECTYATMGAGYACTAAKDAVNAQPGGMSGRLAASAGATLHGLAAPLVSSLPLSLPMQHYCSSPEMVHSVSNKPGDLRAWLSFEVPVDREVQEPTAPKTLVNHGAQTQSALPPSTSMAEVVEDVSNSGTDVAGREDEGNSDLRALQSKPLGKEHHMALLSIKSEMLRKKERVIVKTVVVQDTEPTDNNIEQDAITAHADTGDHTEE